MKKSAAVEGKRLMTVYVAFLRALYNIHQHAHWETKGREFYGNHLLFERLYEGAQESLDEAAEKTIGIFGELSEDVEKISIEVYNKFSANNFDGDFVQASLKAEQAFLEASRIIYNNLKNSGELTLGMDDLVMSTANKHEVHVYLLKQVIES